MSSFVIKIIAVITMCIDHLYYVIPDSSLILKYIGRISFPLFAFQLTIGYQYTKDVRKYFLRLFLFALISQIPFMLLFNTTNYNIFFTLFLGLLAIYLWDIRKNNLSGIFLLLLFALIAECLHFDYGAFGILTIFVFYVFKDKLFTRDTLFIILTFFKFLPSFLISNFYYPNILLFLFTILPLIFLHLFNGKKGKNMKYFLYLFYPIHIIVFYMIKICLF